ncbi:MAG: hypothetical protein ABH878_06710 [bacterium]
MDIGAFSRFPQSYYHWKEIDSGRATCLLLTRSSHDLPLLPAESVDAIITDPPFGGNVQYAELSDFYLVWVKEFLNLQNGANKELEAIETRHQGFEGAKDRKFYEDMLYQVFKECRRVIKPEGWLVLTFHNRDIGVWMAMNRAAIRAGFCLPPQSESINRGMVYQPAIQNYTQTIHQKRAGSMLGDFILSFRPTEHPLTLDSVLQQLPTEQEKGLYAKAEEIIRYHGGADETTLMTGLLPYLQEQGLLARLARFELRYLLGGGNFVYNKKDKKWYAEDMVDSWGSIKPMDFIPAEVQTLELIINYLHENQHASMDELLRVIYTNLVNAHRPQMETIQKVLDRDCERIKVKGEKREHYCLKAGVRSPLEIQREKDKQIVMVEELSISLTHNGIILRIAEQARQRGLYVHVGVSEQRKNESLGNISLKLTHYELGMSKRAFEIIRQIDILILHEYTLLTAVEVVTSLGTLNKAINDRFRNLKIAVPNLNVGLFIVVPDGDFIAASKEINSPANLKDGLSESIQLVRLSAVTAGNWVFTE